MARHSDDEARFRRGDGRFAPHIPVLFDQVKIQFFEVV
jgi:hypothetical protein